MKRTILAVMAVLMIAGQAAAWETDQQINQRQLEQRKLRDQQRRAERLKTGTDHYSRSVNSILSVVLDGKRFADYVAYYCGGGEGLGNDVWQYNKVMSEGFNAKNAGSRMECNGSHSNGMVYVQGVEYYLVDGDIARIEDNTRRNGTAWEINADSLIFRSSDRAGNYVVIQYDESSPNRSRVIDAKLPISINERGETMNYGGGVAIERNRLIDAANRLYPQAPNVEYTLDDFAHDLLLSPEMRDRLIKSLTAKPS